MKKDEIVSILRELHNISGFRVSLHGTDFAEMAAYPERPLPFCSCLHRCNEEYNRCLECDRTACKKVSQEGKAIVYKCSHGLTEAVCPLYNFGTLTGYLMMGQVSDGEVKQEELVSAVIKQAGSRDAAEELVRGIAVHPKEKISSFVKILTICAEYITLINALPGTKPTVAELAKYYIIKNYDKRTTLLDICRAIGCSKSTLISAFKQEWGTTVNSYINEVRIEEAKRLLASTQKTMSEISDLTGFYDQAYFSKVFSAKTGLTPTDYRRNDEK